MERWFTEVEAFQQQEIEWVWGYHWLSRCLDHFRITTLNFREYLGMKVWP